MGFDTIEINLVLTKNLLRTPNLFLIWSFLNQNLFGPNIKMGFDTIEINLVENVFRQRKKIWLILFVKWEESWNVYMSLCPEPFFIQSVRRSSGRRLGGRLLAMT